MALAILASLKDLTSELERIAKGPLLRQFKLRCKMKFNLRIIRLIHS